MGCVADSIPDEYIGIVVEVRVARQIGGKTLECNPAPVGRNMRIIGKGETARRYGVWRRIAANVGADERTGLCGAVDRKMSLALFVSGVSGNKSLARLANAMNCPFEDTDGALESSLPLCNGYAAGEMRTLWPVRRSWRKTSMRGAPLSFVSRFGALLRKTT
jgi:hypothetical protein